MTIGIILAAGKGSRLQSKTKNKTALLFNGKSLVQYGLHLFEGTADKTIIVVGAFAESVRQITQSNPHKIFVHQYKRLGTGHALVVAIKQIEKLGFSPERVLVGYGDHMMFYTKQIVRDLISLQETKNAAITLISTDYTSSNFFGRIVRDTKGYVSEIVEYKDATEEQKNISEINAGFYCFDYQFLLNNYKKLKKSPVSGEYYINDFIRLAKLQNEKVIVLKIPFHYVGIGINTKDEFEESQAFHKEVNSKEYSPSI